jgi:hypothetical protein
VVGGVLLKLYLQLFIVLSPADGAGPAVCTRLRRVVAVLMIQRVVFSDPYIRSISSFVIVRWCCARTSLVARVKLITARTASMSGFQSSVSVVDLPPSRRESLFSPVHPPKIFRCLLHPPDAVKDEVLS